MVLLSQIAVLLSLRKLRTAPKKAKELCLLRGGRARDKRPYSKGLDGVVVSRGNKVLTEAEIDLVRRELEAKCRDVQY
jgi:hypothetical protein